MIEEHDIQTKDVASMNVSKNEHKVKNLRHHNPQTGLEAKFSLSIATMALLEKEVDRQFVDAKVNDPRVQEFMKRSYFRSPEMPRHR
jgi:2-methylcitrate dehydratase PrpD